jgi:hypothetical protein
MLGSENAPMTESRLRRIGVLFEISCSAWRQQGAFAESQHQKQFPNDHDRPIKTPNFCARSNLVPLGRFELHLVLPW